MTSPESTGPAPGPLGVAVIGYPFMGRVHPHAWSRVGNHFDVPAFEQKVLIGRDADAVHGATHSVSSIAPASSNYTPKD